MTIPDLSTAEAGSVALDAAIDLWVNKRSIHGPHNWPPYSTSVDAAVALVGRLLPGTRVDLIMELQSTLATLAVDVSPLLVKLHEAEAPTAPLAILRALQAAIGGE